MQRAGIFLFIAVLCAGCGPGNTRPEAASNTDAHAAELTAAGDHRAAAEEYLRLAAANPKRESFYQLQAAQSYLDATELTTAAGLLAQVSAHSRAEAFHRELLQARLALLQHRPAEALSFSAEQDDDAPASLQSLRHAIRAEAFEQTGNFTGAIPERIALSSETLAPGAVEANLDSLWSDLNRIDAAALRNIKTDGGPELQGWIDLIDLNHALMGKPDALRTALAAWTEGHPSHAAAPYITGRILAAAERYHLLPQHVALLVPLSGQFRQAAEAIRDGFLAAWYAQNEFRPEVSIYDANSLNVLDQYGKALADGADFVVGPLEKAAVASLMQSDLQTVMTMVLNRNESPGANEAGGLPHTLLPGLIQFGLAPEDEAELAAERAFADGHQRALVIAADNDWGQRLASAFTERWQALGGKLLEQVEYAPGSNDFSTDTREVLNIDSSDARTAQLRQQIGRPVHGGGRLRQDADVIFMAAVPVAARQIVPQLRFFGAEQLPVYASSHVYTGNANPQSDSDMNDVRFPDMPWVLDAQSAAPEIEQAVVRNWSADSSTAQRLYAFGADAFRLIPQLGRLASGNGASLHGLTGELSLGMDGIIQRRLMWAQFVDGVPRPLDPVH